MDASPRSGRHKRNGIEIMQEHASQTNFMLRIFGFVCCLSSPFRFSVLSLPAIVFSEQGRSSSRGTARHNCLAGEPLLRSNAGSTCPRGRISFKWNASPAHSSTFCDRPSIRRRCGSSYVFIFFPSCVWRQRGNNHRARFAFSAPSFFPLFSGDNDKGH